MERTADNRRKIAAISISQNSGSMDSFCPGAEGESGPLQWDLYDGDSLSLGRANSNGLVLSDGRVSRHHALLSVSASGVLLSDLSSLNGTFVNSRRISTPVNLRSDDVIEVGSTKIRIKLFQGAAGFDEAGQQTQNTELTTVLATVLVADVAGYTQLSEMLPGAEIARMLSRWIENTANIIRRREGEIDKCIGDCVMAIWRSAPSNEAEVRARTTAAVLAAGEIITGTKNLAAKQWPHEAQHPWRCRVALNTGEALMGGVGGKEARDFTVLGDSVNIAFRLEDIAAKRGEELLFSASTAEFLDAKFPVKRLGEAEIEGRRDKVELFTIE